MEYMHDEQDPYLAYSKVVLIDWLNKLLFANLIQNQFDAAKTIGDISTGCKINQAIDVFNYITEVCDFYNVFRMLPFSDLLPQETWEDVITFNELLSECDMAELKQDYTHRILEESISVSKRQIAGQYPTPEPLAQLLSEIAVRDSYGNAWDCCCGTGTIGCSLWSRKRDLLAEIDTNAKKTAYETTWLSDIHDFPLQIATQSFSALSPLRLPLRVVRKNVFNAKAQEPVQLIDPITGNKESFEFPLFKSIASNLPFVDFNTTEITVYDAIKREMRDSFHREYNISLSDRNDLYCYITLFLDTMLDNEGYMCLLTSNSWLCTSAGDSFMSALQATFDIDSIYVNGTNRWFNNADVMNAILVLKKKTRNSKPVCYMGSINSSLDDLANPEIRNKISRKIISHSSECNLVSESQVSWGEMSQLRSLGLSYYTMCHDVSFILNLT